MKFSAVTAACLLASAAGAQAQSWLDVYAPPANYAISGLGSGGQSAVAATNAGNVYLPASPGAWTAIGGNSPGSGFSGSVAISASGQLISGNATAANGYSQAAVYNVATDTWTALGSLGYHSTTVINGLNQEGSAMAISADGSTVVGSAYFNTTGTTATRTHPVAYRNGQVYDLNVAGGTSQTGVALSTNGNGTLIGGYASNSSIGSLWAWNGSGYTATQPKIADSKGVLQSIQTAAISYGGRYVAGGSVNALAVNYGTSTAPRVFSQATLWDTTTNSGILIPYDHVIDTTQDIDLNMKTTVAGVSDSGLVIGSFTTNVGGTTALLNADAWIYNAGTGTTLSFDDYLTSLGVGLASTQHVWNLYSMAADGSAIAGIYYDSVTNQSSAFLLHIAAVPEPGTWAMFALALPLVAGFASRRRRAEA